MKSRLHSVVMGAAIALSLLIAPCDGAERAIKDVMKSVMKGGSSTFKTVSSGKGTDADAQKLLEYLKSLPGNTPPKGNAADWKNRTTKLVQAASGVVAKKPGATDALKTAGDCKGCHIAHRKLLGF